jgi:hypothetical protein
LSNAAHLDADFLKRAFSEVSESVYEEVGLQIPAEQLRFDVYRNSRGGLSCEGRMYYEGPLQQLLPALPHFGDHLTPAILLSMNTGLRRGELLALRWDSIDFGRQMLTVEGGTAKSRQTRHVALNNEAMGALNRWREQTHGGRRIFEVRTGFKTAWAKLLKRANITKFRWHDLRHHFASRLVQVGLPLNTVRDLLGHNSVAMSLRYAHLAPDQRREAVAKLNKKPLLARTMRLQWNQGSHSVFLSH